MTTAKLRPGVKPVAHTDLSAYMIKHDFTNASFAKSLRYFDKMPHTVTVARWRAGGKISEPWRSIIAHRHPECKLH